MGHEGTKVKKLGRIPKSLGGPGITATQNGAVVAGWKSDSISIRRKKGREDNVHFVGILTPVPVAGEDLFPSGRGAGTINIADASPPPGRWRGGRNSAGNGSYA